MIPLPFYSRIGNQVRVVLLLGAALSGFASYMMLKDLLISERLNILQYLIAGTALVFCVACLLGHRLYYQVMIDETGLRLSRFGGLYERAFLWRDLTAHEILKGNSKNASSRILRLYAYDGRYYNIDSDVYSNFRDMESLIKKKLPATHEGKTRKAARDARQEPVFMAILLLVGCIMVTLLGKQAFRFRVNETDLRRYTGTLADKPEIRRTTGKNKSNYVKMSLNERLDLDFDIGGTSYDAMYAFDFVTDSKVGDTIHIWVDVDDYRSKITREQPLGFEDTYFAMDTLHLEIFRLEHQNRRVYLSEDNYVQVYRSDFRLLFYIFLALTIGFAGWCIKVRNENKSG